MSTVSQTSSGKLSAEFLASVNPKTETKSDSSMEITQDRFLKLLTTQLKNQDPLNPMDNAEMTSQMAQISTVTGIEKLNATLQALTSNSTDAQVMQAAAMLGREVLVEGNQMAIATQEGTVAGGVAGFELLAPVDDVKVTIYDANGLVMRNMDFGPLKAGVHDFLWNGQNDAGVALPDGSYTFKVEATRGSEAVTPTLLQAGMVTGITRNGTDVGLQLANLAGDLGITKVDAVKQIY